MAAAPWADEILDFWFCEMDRQAWFEKSDATDALIRNRFLALHEKLAGEITLPLDLPPRMVLAAVMAFDQFPRNMFRGTPRAFATDSLALALARQMVDGGHDRSLGKDERMFLYLPFEHSEQAAEQIRCCALFALLEDPELLRYAQAHKDIIDRFGRFPHRNPILGRVSTPEEIEFLKQPGSSF
ncbi:MAG: DUF924 domain-containing protein [Sphingomonadales bacterium]|nr:DUF924 domain-containing protein [Sphingomonadales bacterium]